MNEKRDELGVTLGLDGYIYAIGGFGGNSIKIIQNKIINQN